MTCSEVVLGALRLGAEEEAGLLAVRQVSARVVATATHTLIRRLALESEHRLPLRNRERDFESVPEPPSTDPEFGLLFRIPRIPNRFAVLRQVR